MSAGTSCSNDPRTPSRIRLVTAFSVLAVLLSLMFWMVFCSSSRAQTLPESEPLSLYRQAWQETSRSIYDQDGLNNWNRWKHAHDTEIVTWQDSERFTKEMLDTLGDPRTKLMNPGAVRALLHRAMGTASGVGLVFYAYGSPSGVLFMGSDHRPMPQHINGYPMVGRVIVDSPAHASGILPGDVIKEIDGKSALGKSMDELRKLLSDSQYTHVTLVINRDGQELMVALVREEIHEPPVVVKQLTADIGYIRLETFIQNDALLEFENGLNELSNCKAIVVDLRSNLGGSIDTAFDITSFFLDRGIICTTFSRSPGDGYTQTRYELTPDTMRVIWPNDKREDSSIEQGRVPVLCGDKPVVILTNCYSASASELMTGALKDNKRVTVLGTTTLGKGVGQTMIPLTNGYRLSVTSMQYLTPNGTWLGDAKNTVACGIAPDVKVLPSPGLIYGSSNDNQLKAAVELLSQQLKQQILVITPTTKPSPRYPSVRQHKRLRQAAQYR
ncbi:MAG: PDZ domain-containing protein [Candidatus Melainabacteria bacterium]|nr:PDZ domain-containing protein [Candidatus Melainabacteria bacterium]